VAAPPKPDVGALIKDSMVMKTKNNHLTLVFWWPSEVLLALVDARGELTQQGLDGLATLLTPYQLIAVADGEQQIGQVAYGSVDELRKQVTIEDGKGNVLRPLDDSSLPIGVSAIISGMRPALEKASGSLRMTLLVFSSAGPDGQRIANPGTDGALTIHVGAVLVRYHTPLGSLLPEMTDPKSGESFPGNYHFNPYTGDKLRPAPAQP
jgi:hypothetical protein